MINRNLERDRAIADAYRAGALMRDIACDFSLSISRVSGIVSAQGASLSREELARRSTITAKHNTGNPAVCAKIAEGVRAAWARGAPLGRKTIFADDPERRIDYLNMREAYGAAYAREVMGIAA